MAIDELGEPFQQQKPPSWWEMFWIPLIGLIIFFAFDYWLIPQAVILPPMLTLLLGYSSYRLPVRALIIWMLIYASAVYIMLQIAPQSYAPVTPYVRAVSFVLGGLVIVFITAHRMTLEKSNEAFFNVVKSLPLTVIVSNISGDILLLNTEAKRMLEYHGHDLVDNSFFSAFFISNDRAEAIEQYLGFFKQIGTGPHLIKLAIRGKPPRFFDALLTVVGTGRMRYAITVVNQI